MEGGQMKPYMPNRIWLVLPLALFIITNSVLADQGDFNIDGAFEAALDLPRILFLLKRDPNGPALEPIEGSYDPFDIDDIFDFGDIFDFDDIFNLDDLGIDDIWGDGLGLDDIGFEVNWAFLDTGVSSILLSKETATYLGIKIDPNGQYVDPGVGGEEYFDISEPLYIGVADYDDPNPEDQSHYELNGPYRAMIKQNNAEGLLAEPYDLLGMPVIFGKTVVFNTRAPSSLEYFTAQIRYPDDPSIPQVDFEVPIRFEKFVMPNDPRQIPPLPVLAYNPVIDNIIIEDGGYSSSGTYLFDTGGSISLISTAQAMNLGLIDANGEPLREPDYSVPIGGIGLSDMVEIPGYQIEHLIVPTLNGYNLVYYNARLGVQDISVLDEVSGELITLDGVFGSNFIIATMETATWDVADTPFDNVILDTNRAVLGFDVNDLYVLPVSIPTCGDANHPWPEGDLNRDCSINILDIEILVHQWLNECNLLNWNCSGTDLNSDGITNFVDYAELMERM
jgi:hypothetical protein